MNSALAGLRLAMFFALSGAAFTLGVGLVCRWLKWSPVNITLNVYRREDE